MNVKTTFSKDEALEYLAKPSRIILREFSSEETEGVKLLILGSSRPERARNVHVALLFPGGGMKVFALDFMRSVVANSLEWNPHQKACEILRTEIAKFFFTQLARSRDSMVLFRFDTDRLFQTRTFIRHLTAFNRLVIEAKGNEMHDLGARELETGLPDKLLWNDNCHGKLDGEVYHIRRTIVHYHLPGSVIHDQNSINRHCDVFAEVLLDKYGKRRLEIKKTYPLSCWPTANRLLDDHAEEVRKAIVKLK